MRPLAEAMALAKEAGLNLVEVAPRERPPVCRLMDYGRFRYEQSKVKSVRAPRPKELQLRARIGEHDRPLKVATLRRLLEEGHAVRVTVTFRGRERAHPEFGQRLLQHVLESVRDVARAEHPPLLQSRELGVRLLPLAAPAKPAPAPARIEFLGTIREPLPNATYRVELDSGEMVLAHIRVRGCVFGALIDRRARLRPPRLQSGTWTILGLVAT